MFQTFYVRHGADDDYDPVRVVYLRDVSMTTICAWCPDSHLKTANAVAAGQVVSHTMCPRCAAKFNAELDRKEKERHAAV